MIAFSESTKAVVLEKKISEFYRADLKKAYPEDRPLLSIIYKETRGEIKNLVVSVNRWHYVAANFFPFFSFMFSFSFSRSLVFFSFSLSLSVNYSGLEPSSVDLSFR